MSLETERVRWEAGGTLILDGVTLSALPGRVLGLLGPNGSGKSSLLRLLAGLRRPQSGEVRLDGRPMAGLRRAAIARRVALVEQHAETEAPVTVEEVVRLGRTPHRSAFAPWGAADQAAVEAALRQTGLLGLRSQRWQTLSGGERQRAQIARALAQQPEELLLDEPTNHLDIRHQLEILGLVRRLGLTSIMALHDLNLAALYCDALALLQAGRVVAAGPPEAVLTPQRIEAVYGVRASVTVSALHGRPQVLFAPLPDAGGEAD
ncbi:ABC transporter ATP-binding protein [Pseudoroseomonas cervicalis]|uniref:ABC transporter ATP-binding protein n=1 Tax=Teichococcus cervicalis TaxID=204525 RepID=UPI0027875DA8|nr:ABC transporter ATP-binding protein [Pseudoroseomonas cervicalis]MDQ1077830.1 iron complex transport system ATP-binding protein [Pseudoroseomonas cervicalis]